MRGSKTGGRTQGTPNRMTTKQREAMQSSGLSPLDYLLSVMRNDSLSISERMEAARAAAPFVHPKLSAVAVSTSTDAEEPVTINLVGVAPIPPGEGQRAYMAMLNRTR